MSQSRSASVFSQHHAVRLLQRGSFIPPDFLLPWGETSARALVELQAVRVDGYKAVKPHLKTHRSST